MARLRYGQQSQVAVRDLRPGMRVRMDFLSGKEWCTVLSVVRARDEIERLRPGMLRKGLSVEAIEVLAREIADLCDDVLTHGRETRVVRVQAKGRVVVRAERSSDTMLWDGSARHE